MVSVLYRLNILVTTMDVIFLKNLMKYHPFNNFVVVFHNDIGYHELIINFGIVMTLPQSFNLSEKSLGGLESIIESMISYF